MLSHTLADHFVWVSPLSGAGYPPRALSLFDLQLGVDHSRALAGPERWRRLCEALQVPEALMGTLDSVSVTHTLTLHRSNPHPSVLLRSAARDSLRHVREQW